MNLTTHIEEGRATLLRDKTKIGELALDSLWQIADITINPAAAPEEDEQIVRLASSHVAQFMPVARSLTTHGVLVSTYPAIPGSTPERSRELLDFEKIPQEHSGIPVDALEGMLSQLGITIRRTA